MGQTVRIRIIMHLMKCRHTMEDHILPRMATQAGIAEALGISLNHAGNELRILRDEGYVEAKSKYIAEENRKLNANLLTPAGRILGQQLSRGRAAERQAPRTDASRPPRALTEEDIVRMLSEQMGMTVRDEPGPPPPER